MNRNFGALDQIGIVVRHLDRVRDCMESIFGILPTTTAVTNYEAISYRGEIVDTAMEALSYRHFGIELPFIAPLGSENVWDDFLQQRGEGIHHLRFRVHDQMAAMVELADLGMVVAQAGESTGPEAVSYAYFDSVPELGFTLGTITGTDPVIPPVTSPAATTPGGPAVARMIPLALPINLDAGEPLLLNLIDIDQGHTTLRFRIPVASGFGRGQQPPVLLLDDERGTDFGNPVAQLGLPPLENLLQVSFAGVPHADASSLLIRCAGDPGFELTVALAASRR